MLHACLGKLIMVTLIFPFMKINLDSKEIETLLECLRYSKQRVSGVSGTADATYAMRQEKLRNIELVEEKLRHGGQTEVGEQL